MSLWWWLLWTQPAVPVTWTASAEDTLQIDRNRVMQIRCGGHPDGTQHVWVFDANYDLVVPEKAP